MNSWCLLALAGAMVGGCRSGGKPQERFETYYAEASPSGFTDRELNRLSKRAWAVVKAEPEESPRAFDALARVVDECARGGSYSRASRVRARAMSELIPRSRRDDVRTMRLIRALAPLGRFDAEEAEAEEREFAQYLDKIEAGRRGSAWVGAGVAWAKSHHRVERDLHVRTIPASERDEARQWISKCYYDAEHLPDSAWAREVRQFCSRGMNQLDQLVIGRNAPDLESTDFYSRRLRLSEYR
ncbi:MAG: hypothetical protein OER88_03945, partial [Planctomycetota bacterium]|nr:hypothetical protein [Planctomycetota bacterium]